MISDKAVIHENVTLGKNCVIEDYVIIGVLPVGYSGPRLRTVIGDNSVIRSHTVIYAGNIIGNNFATGNKVNIREINRIGNNVSIGTHSVIEHHIKIGHRVRIQSLTLICEYTVLEEGCWIGPYVLTTNSKYPNSKNSKKELRSPRVKKFAVVGGNSTLLPGVSIGRRALVGAGSVVVGNIPDGWVVVGNPARKVNEIDNLPYT
jgi:acetyltransferase-like isoleucine patch superfamily enzyme